MKMLRTKRHANMLIQASQETTGAIVLKEIMNTNSLPRQNLKRTA